MANDMSKGQATDDPSDAWAIIEFAPDAVFLVDESGYIELANRAAQELFGYKRADLIDLEIETLLPESRRDAHRAHRCTYVESPRTRPMGLGLDLWARHADGSEFPVEVSLSSVDLPHGQRVVATVRDLTLRRAIGAGDQSSSTSGDGQRSQKEAIARFEEEMKAALIENERANDALCHFLTSHRGNSRKIMQKILDGNSPPEVLDLEGVAALRDEYQDRLARFEASRKELRLVLLRWAMANGVSASKVATGLGISRQMAVRLAREARMSQSV